AKIYFDCVDRGVPHAHVFPTRRSSDLERLVEPALCPLPVRAVRRYERPECLPGQMTIGAALLSLATTVAPAGITAPVVAAPATRSEEHTSELQSRENFVCRLLREKKKL